MTRGEIVLIVFIFALVYGAGHLPKLAASLGGSKAGKQGKGNAQPLDD